MLDAKSELGKFRPLEGERLRFYDREGDPRYFLGDEISKEMKSSRVCDWEVPTSRLSLFQRIVLLDDIDIGWGNERFERKRDKWTSEN